MIDPKISESQAHHVAGHWVARNVSWLKSIIRITLGVAWLFDGYLKFQPGMIEALPGFVTTAKYGQPSWLQPWFNFWSQLASSNPVLFAYTIGPIEVALGLALVIGFMRKIVYICGFFFSLLIWSVPEGFGGPYTASTTDIGTGIVYSFVFLSLIMINALSGPSKYSLDYYLEHRYSSWKRFAEFN